MTNSLPDEDKKQIEKAKKAKENRKLGVWAIIGIVVVALVVVSGAGGGYLIHLSDTSPEFCSTCHIMEENVTSYLSGNTLDNIHLQAGVQCKSCHDYPVEAEVKSGIKFIMGDYTVDESGSLAKRSYSDDICLQCHISKQFVAEATNFLFRNPHDSHNGMLSCKTCHISHGEQIDYCSECHDNGSQRMTGDRRLPRGTIGEISQN